MKDLSARLPLLLLALVSYVGVGLPAPAAAQPPAGLAAPKTPAGTPAGETTA